MNPLLPRLFAAGLAALVLCSPVAAQDEERQQTLSTTLEVESPRVLLFEGQSSTVSMEVIAHPNEDADWADIKVRLKAELPPDVDLSELPVKIEAFHAASGKTLSVNPSEWYEPSYFGLGSSRRKVKFKVTFGSKAYYPIRLIGEVNSPHAEKAATAPFDVHCAQMTLLDLRDVNDPADDIPINQEDTAWMTHHEAVGKSVPIMPRLVGAVTGLPGDHSVQWLLQSQYRRRIGHDDVQIPDDGWLKLPGNQAWKIYDAFEDKWGHFGGEAKLSYRVVNEEDELIYSGVRVFAIRGRNPSDDGVKQFVEQKRGKYWYAWAVAQHESRQGNRVFNQFNSYGRVANEPNYGPPDGWGLYQIDSARGAEVTTNETWDWRTNVEGGIGELRTCEEHTHAYMDAIKRTYPSTWEEPPATYTPPGCETVLTWEEASIIQLYNGASIVRRLKNASGYYTYYRSCWKFYPGNPSGKRWRFVPNRNNYVYKVVKHEFEGGYKIEE